MPETRCHPFPWSKVAPWAALLVLVTLVVYFPALQNGFNNWDDHAYVTGNPYLPLTARNLAHSFFGFEHHGMYLPLTALSFSLNHFFGGLSPFGYHLVNVLLHLANVVLVFVAVSLLTRRLPAAVAVAALFALHPINVEAVAYVAGRRDVLYALFFLSAGVCYLKYADGRRARYYWLAVGLFLLSLLSKGVAISFVVVVVLVDWVRGRSFKTRRVLLEKIPSVLLAGLSGVITIAASWSAKGGYGLGQTSISSQLPKQLVFACFGVSRYLQQLLVPYNLSLFHPYPPEKSGIPFHYWLGVAVVLGLFGLGVFLRRRSRLGLFGLLFFIGTVVWVLQLVRNSAAITNDHYLYVPAIGIFLLVALLGVWLGQRFAAGQRVIQMTFVLALVVLGMMTRDRTRVFLDSVTVWTDVLKKYPGATVALNNRGVALKEKGDLQAALSDFSRAVEIDPSKVNSLTNRANLGLVLGDARGALVDYSRAAKIEPKNPEHLTNCGLAQSKLGDSQAAQKSFEAALRLDPDYVEALVNQGATYFELGEKARAAQSFDAALAIDPTHATARYNRAYLAILEGRPAEALPDLNQALQTDPNYRAAYYHRGLVLLSMERREDGCRDMTRAAELGLKPAADALSQLCPPP